MKVFLLKTEDINDYGKIDFYLSEISEINRQRFLSFFRKKDAMKTLLGEILARVTACEELGLFNNTMELVRNGYGKPFFKGCRNHHFNLSHSGEIIVCVTDISEVGIDIEKIKPVNLDIAKRFFAEEEISYLTAQKNDEQVNCFYTLWTMKESYIKMKGKGLSLPLNSFSVISPEGVIDYSKVNIGSFQDDISFKIFNQYENYKIALCSNNKSSFESFYYINQKELLKEFEKISMKKN